MQIDTRLGHIKKTCSGGFENPPGVGCSHSWGTHSWGDMTQHYKKCDTKTPVWTKRNQFLISR